MSSKFWEEYNYDEALDRALKLVPESIRGDSRFEIPKINSSIEGNRTFFKNFKEIANFLNRKESHLLKFLTTELGTNGNVEGQRAIFQGKHGKMQISKAIDRYLKNYVFCATCGKPDTVLELKDRIIIMRCEACGATQAVRPIK